MITLAGVIVDAARINIAEPQIQRAVETSIRSTLAGYSTPLKEQYGLFALNENGDQSIEKTISYYLNKNLMIDKEYLNENKIGDYVDIYDYEIESIKVEPIFNMSENPVTRQQILEYMKYRAPKEFAKEFLTKLDGLKKAGSTSEAYKEKIYFEKNLKGIESIQRELYKNIHGEYETRIFYFWTKQGIIDHYVRKFNENEFSDLIDEYIQAIKHYQNLKKELKNIKDEKSEKKKRLAKKIVRARKKIEQSYNEMKYEINEYDAVNNSAMEKIDELIEKSKDARDELRKYKTYLNERKNNIMKDSYELLIQEVDEYEKQISYAEKGPGLKEVRDALSNNIKCLSGKGTNKNNVISLIMMIAPNKAKNRIDYIEDIKEDILDRIKIYNNRIEYDYTIKERKEIYKDCDTRKDSQECAKAKTEINGREEKQKGIVIGHDEYSILPSVIKLKSDQNGRGFDANFLWKKNNKVLLKDSKTLDVEFYEQEEAGFSEGAFSFLIGAAEAINPVDIRDEIYINEYIMGTFKNAVSDIDEEFNLRHIKKSDLNTYFDKGEVEYILNGNKSESINQTLMDSKILLTRFGLNSIHVFTCKDKKIVATSIATAVAGWYTGGAGIPILRTLILLGWSMSEAVYDLDELKEGKDIPLYKTEENWKTDWKPSVQKVSNEAINNGKDEKTSFDKSKAMNTSYQDYLRFFLLVQNRDITMNRIQDLIQLNMQKNTGSSDLKLREFNTYIKAEVVVSIKYLFLTQSFIPRKFKTKNNRHEFKVIMYQGY
jgi:hypothetical protein